MVDPSAMTDRADFANIVRLYRASFARCWLPSALLALTWAVGSSALERRIGSSVDTNSLEDLLKGAEQLQRLVASGFFWGLLAAVGSISLLLYCIIVARVYSVVGANALAESEFAAALRSWPGALAAATVYVAATTIGALLLIVPGAYLAGVWQLWLVTLVVERLGPWRALRRSAQLVAGAWWSISTLVTIVAIAAMLPPMLLDALLGLVHARYVTTIAHIALEATLAPVVPVVLVVLYRDRLRVIDAASKRSGA